MPNTSLNSQGGREESDSSIHILIDVSIFGALNGLSKRGVRLGIGTGACVLSQWLQKSQLCRHAIVRGNGEQSL